MATASEIVTIIDEAIVTLIQGGSVSKYIIGGKSVEKFTLDELRSMRQFYSGISASSSDNRTYVEFVQ